MSNYFCYHLHSDLSNGVTNIDSVTKFTQYIDRARECGMRALAFSEHGSLFEWQHKKEAIEQAGMKYVHAAEVYLTQTTAQKVRDNYHCVLIARNYEGFRELNRIVSRSFNRRDGHFYYVPRVTFEELFATSPNILITTACVGGVLGKAPDDVILRFLGFLERNKDRCYLEIGHHPDPKQIAYNKRLLSLSRQTGIPLIAGTDTHALNEEHEAGRAIEQRAHGISFEGEENWDLKFKSYEDLVTAYKRQGALDEEIYLSAIEETNALADRVEPFEIDRAPKYPHIVDNPSAVFREKVQAAVKTHPYALKRHGREALQSRVDEELTVYESTGSIDFMLLQTHLREWEREHGILCGYGRGSVSGSMIAYLLGVTEMDSMRFELNFFRFLNPDRVSMADIDTDYGGSDRDRVKEFLLRDKLNLPNIRTAEIITFNTIQQRGAIKDVCRALYKDRPGVDYLRAAEKIIAEAESGEKTPAQLREKYEEVFRYVDIVRGTIVSVGSHPSGVLIADLPLEEEVGLCSLSTSPYPVSMLNMKELDDLKFVKLDILGLDNIAVINDTCAMLGIDRLTPDNVDLEDERVWREIREDTTLIFQWESPGARRFIRRFLSEETLARARARNPRFSMLKWFSFGSGLLRPACGSFRDKVAAGEFYDNGFDALNEFLAPEAGRLAMQETIMQFLVKFCGYSAAESDTVRRAIAKKRGTETLLPEIRARFIAYSSERYGLSRERCAEVIEPFLKIIEDASDYSFSWNHSDAYAAVGYICGFLRTYHPLEFLTAALNVFESDTAKTGDITAYARGAGIEIVPPRWGFARSRYNCDKVTNRISKGLSSVKYLSAAVAEELYALSREREYPRFVDVLAAIAAESSLDSRQLDILIKLDFFGVFGNQRELLRINDMFVNLFKKGEVKKIPRAKVDGTQFEPIVAKYSTGFSRSGGVAKSYTVLDVPSMMREGEDLIKSLRLEDFNSVEKARNFAGAMGFPGYVSGRESDRPNLYVTRVARLTRRSDGRFFAFAVNTKSIGSGKESRFTVKRALYQQKPIAQGDIVRCGRYFRDSGGHFVMDDYSILSRAAGEI